MVTTIHDKFTHGKPQGGTMRLLIAEDDYELADRVNGLDAGADDHLPKPFPPR